MDILWVVLISTALLVFCLWRVWQSGYDKGWHEGSKHVIEEWKKTLQ